MDKETLDWIFAKGPLVFLVLLALIDKIFKWNKELVVQKDELGTPKIVYVGKSETKRVVFGIIRVLVVCAILSIFIYSLYFRGWVGN